MQADGDDEAGGQVGGGGAAAVAAPIQAAAAPAVQSQQQQAAAASAPAAGAPAVLVSQEQISTMMQFMQATVDMTKEQKDAQTDSRGLRSVRSVGECEERLCGVLGRV